MGVTPAPRHHPSESNLKVSNGCGKSSINYDGVWELQILPNSYGKSSIAPEMFNITSLRIFSVTNDFLRKKVIPSPNYTASPIWVGFLAFYGAETLNTATFVQWPIWWQKSFEFWQPHWTIFSIAKHPKSMFLFQLLCERQVPDKLSN